MFAAIPAQPSHTTAATRLPPKNTSLLLQQRAESTRVSTSAMAGGSGLLLLTHGQLLADQYVVGRLLNHGATAQVYAGVDRATRSAVALKVVPLDAAASSSSSSLSSPQSALLSSTAADVVRREVALCQRVGHENLVRLVDVVAHGRAVVIVLELVSGPDLLDLLNEHGGRLPEPAAAFFFAQALRAVLHLHAHGFCHRDLKPENVMVERSTQRLKLIDFGLSKHCESVATLQIGTVDYLAPELLRPQLRAAAVCATNGGGSHNGGGGSHNSPAAPPPPKTQQQQQQQQLQGRSSPPYDGRAVDAWALGVVLFLLVTGCYAFESPDQPNNLAATLLNVACNRRQPLPRHVSPGCAAVIDALLNPDPQKRAPLASLADDEWLRGAAARHAAALGRSLSWRFAPLHDPAAWRAWLLPAVVPAASDGEALATARSGGGGGTSGSSSDGVRLSSADSNGSGSGSSTAPTAAGARSNGNNGVAGGSVAVTAAAAAAAPKEAGGAGGGGGGQHWLLQLVRRFKG